MKALCRIKHLYSILLAFIVSVSSAQTIKGRIYEDDNNKEFIPFATVWVKNTKIGCTADSVGNYILDITPIADTTKRIIILFSFINHKTHEVIINSKRRRNRTINIGLKVIPSCSYPEYEQSKK